MRGPHIQGCAGTPRARAGSRPRGAAGPGPRRSGSWCAAARRWVGDAVRSGRPRRPGERDARGRPPRPRAGASTAAGTARESVPAAPGAQGRASVQTPSKRRSRRHPVPRRSWRGPAGGSPVPPPARACAGSAEPPGSLPSRAAALRGSAAPLPTAATGQRDRRRRSKTASRATA